MVEDCLALLVPSLHQDTHPLTITMPNVLGKSMYPKAQKSTLFSWIWTLKPQQIVVMIMSNCMMGQTKDLKFLENIVIHLKSLLFPLEIHLLLFSEQIIHRQSSNEWVKNSRKMVFCYQNCSDLLCEKIVLVIEKNFWNSQLKAENLQKKIWDH